jgi:Fe(3+) dicitrate transport protein
MLAHLSKLSRQITIPIHLRRSISSSACTGHLTKVFGTMSVCSGWEFDNRTETRQFSPIDFIIVNTGSTRHRGLEGELSYDLLAQSQHPPLAIVQPPPDKTVIDAKTAPVPGVPKEFYPLQLIVFSNVQFLDAEFTASEIPDQVGKTPAFAPDFLLKGGLTFRKQNCFNITFTSVYVAQQFWSDMDISLPTVPAKIPAYKVFNLSGELPHEEPASVWWHLQSD